jgi:hypothetical protein
LVHMGGWLFWRNVCLPQVMKSFQSCRGVPTTFYITLVYESHCWGFTVYQYDTAWM